VRLEAQQQPRQVGGRAGAAEAQAPLGGHALGPERVQQRRVHQRDQRHQAVLQLLHPPHRRVQLLVERPLRCRRCGFTQLATGNNTNLELVLVVQTVLDAHVLFDPVLLGAQVRRLGQTARRVLVVVALQVVCAYTSL